MNGDVRLLVGGIVLHVAVEGWDPRRVNTGRHYILDVDAHRYITVRGGDRDRAEDDLVAAGIAEVVRVAPDETTLQLTERAFEEVDGPARLDRRTGWRPWGELVPVELPRYPSVDAFHDDVPARRDSVEVDYGVGWVDGGREWPRHRVSWVEATGELYAVCLTAGYVQGSGGVEVLGLALTREEADGRLDGWADEPARPLDWARERLAPSAPDAKIAPR